MSGTLQSQKLRSLINEAEGQVHAEENRWFPRHFPNPVVIAMAGLSGTGKTTLVKYLETGTALDDMSKQMYDKTLGLIPRTFAGTTRAVLPGDGKFSVIDAGGDGEGHYALEERICHQNPHGIIFMVDNFNIPEHQDRWTRLCHFLLNKRRAAKRLCSVLVLANKMDEWPNGLLSLREQLGYLVGEGGPYMTPQTHPLVPMTEEQRMVLFWIESAMKGGKSILESFPGIKVDVQLYPCSFVAPRNSVRGLDVDVAIRRFLVAILRQHGWLGGRL